MYFTINPGRGGFTDQLMRFYAFYKLGYSLGYEYQHQEFKSDRSSAVVDKDSDFNVFNFLGFNQYLYRKHTPDSLRGLTKIKCSLDNIELDERGVDSLSALHSYVHNLSKNQSANAFVEFALSPGSGRNFFHFIHTAIRDNPDGLNLEDAYLKEAPIPSRVTDSSDSALNILVHLREGDTAVVPVPWGDYFAIRALKKVSIQNDNRKTTSRGRYVSVKEFSIFWETLSRYLSRLPFKAKLFSDGFERSYHKLVQHRRRLDLNADQVQQIKRIDTDDINRQVFACIPQSEGLELVIGECREKLCQLLESAMSAQLIIITERQRMIPKLLSLYRGNANFPLVMVLGKDDHSLRNYLAEAKYKLGLLDRVDRFRGVNVNDARRRLGDCGHCIYYGARQIIFCLIQYLAVRKPFRAGCHPAAIQSLKNPGGQSIRGA